MKIPFQPTNIKIFQTKVTKDKLAQFDAGLVHPVYSTFALGKDVEWACRLFVLEMKEEGEEGIGTYLSIEHLSPALLGSTVKIIATLESVIKNEIICAYEATVGERIIAKGKQTQKIISKAKFDTYLATLKEEKS